MPGREIRCTVNLDIWCSINGLYRPYHVPLDQFYDYISYSKHKRRQLSDRLAIAKNTAQKHALLNSQRQKGFHQVMNNGRKMQPLYLWSDQSNMPVNSSKTSLGDLA
ncbi:hypothetical protein GLOIN_2v1792321 [Rhizophagus clarus]|nr:hypothetical protein GLOIN_2v1792321 [Rhizophagus clarus]